MNCSNLTDQEKIEFAKLMFQPLSSSTEVKDWVKLFLNLEMPLEITDPDSNSSPLDAVWQIYNTFKTNSGAANPGYILMSCREGMKCSIKSTTCVTSDGFKKIEDIKKGDKIWTGFSWQTVTETFDEGIKDALTVKLDGGWTATGTPIHRFWALRNGKEQWVAGKDLNPETDLLCLNVNTDFAKFNKPIEQEKYDIGYFLGLLTGDGGLTFLDSYERFTLTNTDLYILNFYEEFHKKYFPDYKLCKSKKGIEYTIHGQSSCEKLKEWGLKTSYSWEKEIPSFAWAHLDAMKGFIAGVFDTDGCWDKKGDCFFEMTAGKLLDQMQIALTAFGIVSRVRHNSKLYGIQKHLVSRLTIGQTEAAKLEKLGIIFKAKKAQQHKPPRIPNCKDSIERSHLENLFVVCRKYTSRSIRNRKNPKPSLHLYAPYKSCTYPKLQKLIEWMEENHEHNLVSEEDMEIVRSYKKILLNKWKKFKVEEAGKQYFYDLTVENEHSYWSNGLISHNTVSVAILETLLLLHFQLDIGHAAATEEQSAVALGYIESFLLKIEPFVLMAGWVNMTQNKRLFKFKTPQQKQPYIKIVICSTKGMNSLHSNVLFLDELDLADPKALKEGKNIVGYSKGIYGVTVYLSTRKYAFGNMSQAIEQADEMNYKIINWNIIDVTERCPTERHKPNGPKQDMYISKNMPLRNATKEEFELLPEVEKTKWDLIQSVHEGCVKCPLLPVCKTRLANKPSTATGGFYKPIISVIQKFRENDPDTAEAQLMCWKPGSTGLVYPRFSRVGNAYTIKQAWETLFGPTDKAINELTLIYAMKSIGILFCAGIDWGYTHDFVVCVVAMIPNGEVWLMETYASPGLEFADQLEIGKTYRDKYTMHKWFADTAMPSHLKSFNKNGMKCPNFKKDVLGGVEAVRSKIVSADGKRRFKVIQNESNKKAITALTKHRFILDGQGNPTLNPDDERGIADICDTLRYIGQNLFPVKGPQKPEAVWIDSAGKILDPNDPEARKIAEIASQHENQMKQEIAKRLGEAPITISTGKKGGFHFTF